MSRIAIPGRDDAPTESRAILDNVNKMLGFVPNLQRLISISPSALGGWSDLMESLSEIPDATTRNTIAFAVSEANGCDFCLAAHSHISTNLAKIPQRRSHGTGRAVQPTRSGWLR